MSSEKDVGVSQVVKNTLLSGAALLSFLLVPLVWVPLILGDWLLERFRHRGPPR